MARGEISEGRKRETALVIVVIAGALAAAGYHQVRVHWPWLLGEPAAVRVGATVRCEPEALEVEPLAVPSAVTWPAAPVYDALRVRVRRAGSVLAHDFETRVVESERVIEAAALPDELREPLRACVEREQAALARASAEVLAPGDHAPLVVRTP